MKEANQREKYEQAVDKSDHWPTQKQCCFFEFFDQKRAFLVDF